MPEIDVKKEIKEELDKLVGKYIPNKIDLENFSNYLYKLCMNKLSSANTINSNMPEVNDMDRQAFMRAVHTMAVFSARDVMLTTLKETYRSVKNQVSLIEVDPNVGVVSSNVQEKDRFVIVPADEGNFKIDLSDNKLKVDDKTKKLLQGEIKKENVVQKNLSPIQEWSSSDKEFVIGSKSLQEFNMSTTQNKSNSNSNNEDFTSDASSFTNESYSYVPEVSKDLDY